MILVSRADQESREPQLSHRTNRDKDEKERMVMGFDVGHPSKSFERIGTSVSQWLREDTATKCAPELFKVSYVVVRS